MERRHPDPREERESEAQESGEGESGFGSQHVVSSQPYDDEQIGHRNRVSRQEWTERGSSSQTEWTSQTVQSTVSTVGPYWQRSQQSPQGMLSLRQGDVSSPRQQPAIDPYDEYRTWSQYSYPTRTDNQPFRPPDHGIRTSYRYTSPPADDTGFDIPRVIVTESGPLYRRRRRDRSSLEGSSFPESSLSSANRPQITFAETSIPHYETSWESAASSTSWQRVRPDPNLERFQESRWSYNTQRPTYQEPPIFQGERQWRDRPHGSRSSQVSNYPETRRLSHQEILGVSRLTTSPSGGHVTRFDTTGQSLWQSTRFQQNPTEDLERNLERRETPVEPISTRPRDERQPLTRRPQSWHHGSTAEQQYQPRHSGWIYSPHVSPTSPISPTGRPLPTTPSSAHMSPRPSTSPAFRQTRHFPHAPSSPAERERKRGRFFPPTSSQEQIRMREGPRSPTTPTSSRSRSGPATEQAPFHSISLPTSPISGPASGHGRPPQYSATHRSYSARPRSTSPPIPTIGTPQRQPSRQDKGTSRMTTSFHPYNPPRGSASRPHVPTTRSITHPVRPRAQHPIPVGETSHPPALPHSSLYEEQRPSLPPPTRPLTSPGYSHRASSQTYPISTLPQGHIRPPPSVLRPPHLPFSRPVSSRPAESSTSSALLSSQSQSFTPQQYHTQDRPMPPPAPNPRPSEATEPPTIAESTQEMLRIVELLMESGNLSQEEMAAVIAACGMFLTVVL